MGNLTVGVDYNKDSVELNYSSISCDTFHHRFSAETLNPKMLTKQ